MSEPGEVPTVEVPEGDFIPADLYIRERIIHTLTIYPRISPSMLQVGIGPAFSPKIWHKVWAELLAEGLVREETMPVRTPTGRSQEVKIVSLAPVAAASA